MESTKMDFPFCFFFVFSQFRGFVIHTYLLVYFMNNSDALRRSRVPTTNVESCHSIRAFPPSVT